MENKPFFSLSANIENGITEGSHYIVTPNVEKVLHEIVCAYQSGIHSFSIIGTYGTGKSSFLLHLEQDLISECQTATMLNNPAVLHDGGFEILNILGDSKCLADLLTEKLQNILCSEKTNPIDLLKDYYAKIKKAGKLLFIAIDEFGKVLEHAAKYDPEEELYFFQKFTEFVNAPSRNIMLLTTLHQNFSAYAGKLNQVQKNEWTKVKGRFQEVVFAEPLEQLLFLAAEHISTSFKENTDKNNIIDIHQDALNCKFINSSFDSDTACRLYPLDAFSAYAITKAIQRYGQNERSLFSFLNTRGRYSISEFVANPNLSYNLAVVYDYIVNSFHSYLNDANADSMAWSSIRIAIERVEGYNWTDSGMLLAAIKIVKAIGLVNLYGNAGFVLTAEQMASYAEIAMDIPNAKVVISELIHLRIIRFAEYKRRLILFEGTDVNIEDEISRASLIVPRPVNYVDDLRKYFNERVSPAKAYYYHRGTPRYFKYELYDTAVDIIPTGDVDGYVQLIFPSSENYYTELVDFSEKCEHATIFVYFTNTKDIVDHLYNIQKYRYILDKVLLDKSDIVANKELMQLLDYEKSLLNKSVSESLFSYSDNVIWIFKGQEEMVKSQRDFNKLLSRVCDDIYSLTPVVNNELFNKHKLSGNITGAKAKYLQALLDNSDKIDLGFEASKFPPEKTIYYSLLKNTGIHVDGEFRDFPSNEGIHTLWNACEEFLRSTIEKPRKLSELVKILSSQPYKIKDGLLDFWLPTYLFIKRQDYALYGENGRYIPTFNVELLDLMKKHIGSFKVKAYAIDGIKLQLFNQYRQFLNLGSDTTIKESSFIETIKPFLFFYNKQLNEYAKHTQKVNHRETIRFREVLANAKDPEKAFLEDLPEALGYDDEKLHNPEEVQNYCNVINRAVRELRGCYNQLIDRIEDHLIECLGLQSVDYNEYVVEIQNRLSKVKPHLLTDRQKEFFQHVMARFDKRQEWYQSVCYAVLGTPLERMQDKQETQLLDDIVYLFRECEKQAVISEGLNYRIDEEEEERSADLESKIDSILTGDNNLDVYTLMRILQKRINHE